MRITSRFGAHETGRIFKVFTPFKRAWLTLFQPPVIGKNRPVALWNVPSALAELVWHPEQAFDYPRIDSTPWAADFETVRAQLRDFAVNECRTTIKRVIFRLGRHQFALTLLGDWCVIGASMRGSLVSRVINGRTQ